MEAIQSKAINHKNKMFNLLNDHMKNNPQDKFLRKSIVKKAFLRSKRGDPRQIRERLQQLKKSKINKFKQNFWRMIQKKN